MRKLLTLLLFILLSYNVFSQTTTYTRGDTIVLTNINKAATVKLEINTKDTLGFVHNLGHGRIDFRVPIISDIRGLSAALAAAGGVIPGNGISSIPSIGDAPGAGLTASNWIIAEFYKSQNPTAALSGGFTYERIATGGQLSETLNYTAGRLAATQPLASNVASPPGIQIVGPSSTNTPAFSQPSAPGTYSNTVTVPINRNVTQTFTLTVYTTDGKSAQAQTGFSSYDKGYAGYATSALVSGKPITADILGFPIADNSGGSTINNQTTAQQGSDKYYCFITTTTRSHVFVNGDPSDAAFNFNIAITFTNLSGGIFTGYAHVSKFQIGSTGAITYVFN